MTPLGISTIPNDAIKLIVEIGKTYYLKVYGVVGEVVIELVDKEIGKSEIESQNYSLVEPKK